MELDLVKSLLTTYGALLNKKKVTEKQEKEQKATKREEPIAPIPALL